jgi:hypothetical protein
MVIVPLTIFIVHVSQGETAVERLRPVITEIPGSITAVIQSQKTQSEKDKNKLR